MSMRTPSTTQTRQALLDLERTNERLSQNQTRIASGNRLTGPGDDPTAAASILSFGNSIEANTQYLRQADTSVAFLKSSEDAVSATIDHTMSLEELAQNGLFATTAAERTAIAPQVDAIRTMLLGLANTQVQGKFVFAGTQTLGTAAHPLPFEDAAPSAGPINYWGDSGSINLEVATNTSVSTNIPGNTVFFGAGGQGSTTDILKAVTDLRDGLNTNNTALIQTASTNLKAVLDNLNQMRADLGGRQAGLLSLKDTLSGLNVTLQDMQNTQQATDYPLAATEYSQDQTIQTATLSVLAKSNKTNLFDYLV